MDMLRSILSSGGNPSISSLDKCLLSVLWSRIFHINPPTSTGFEGSVLDETPWSFSVVFFEIKGNNRIELPIMPVQPKLSPYQSTPNSEPTATLLSVTMYSYGVLRWGDAPQQRNCSLVYTNDSTRSYLSYCQKQRNRVDIYRYERNEAIKATTWIQSAQNGGYSPENARKTGIKTQLSCGRNVRRFEEVRVLAACNLRIFLHAGAGIHR